MRVQLQPALVLHRRPYRESSLLLELLTREYGRVGAVGRGAKRNAGLLQPFQALLVSWSGRGEMVSLGSVEREQSPLPGLSGAALTCGLYVNELLSKLLPRNDPQPQLFLNYQRCLRQLATATELDWQLRRFETQLLADLGYGLVLSHESDSGASLRAEQLYCYQPESGPTAAASGQSPWHVRGATLLALQSDAPPDDRAIRREARRLMQATLDYQLGGQQLKTRDLLQPVWTN